MRRKNQDVIGEKWVRNNQGVMSLDDEAKKVAWRQHYQRLLNVEFSWKPRAPITGAICTRPTCLYH